MRRLFALLRDHHGAAAVELTLVAPFLIVLMFGALELGNYFWNEHVVVKAVRDAARYAGRQPFSSYDCAAGTVSAPVETAIRNLAMTGRISGGAARVQGWNASEVAVSLSCTAGIEGLYANRSAGAPLVTVKASVPYASLFGDLGLASDRLRLIASAQAVVTGL